MLYINTNHRINRFGIKDAKYEYRLIAYFDILGFKSFLLNNGIKEILDVLKNFYKKSNFDSWHERSFKFNSNEKENEFSAQWKDYNRLAAISQDKQVTLFSDLCVISFKSTKEYINWNFTELIDLIKTVQEYLLYRGLLLRGGITYDQLYHTSHYCIGPGLLRSYELERRSTYPRIIIDPKIARFKLFREWINKNHLIMKYEDNYYGTDVIKGFESVYSVLTQQTNQINNLAAMHLIALFETIDLGFKSSNPQTQDKSKWMANRYNDLYEMIMNKFPISSENVSDEFKPYINKVTKLKN